MSAMKRNSSISNISPMINKTAAKKIFLEEVQQMTSKTNYGLGSDENVPLWAKEVLSRQTKLLQMAQILLSDQDQMETAIEGDRRQDAVVVSGLAERQAATATAKAEEDLNSVRKMLDCCEVECLPVKVYRMGMKKDGQNRLLKVELPTRWHARRFLQVKKKLRSDQKFQKVIVRESLSKNDLIERSRLIKLCKSEYDKNPNCDFVVFSGHVMNRCDIPHFRSDPHNFKCMCHNFDQQNV